MNPDFQRYAESLHPSFERLVNMTPVNIASRPAGVPRQGIYLFCEGNKALYVGRTNNLPSRLRQHSIDSAPHNQAVFAFKIAREMTGNLQATYRTEGSRSALSANPEFASAFLSAKRRVRGMDLRYVEEPDQLRQALLEIYVSVALGTPYNDFNTH